MTCEQFRKMTCESLFDHTTAERSAANNHYHSCEACRRELDDYCNKAEERLTDEDRLIGESIARCLKAIDSADPEA